MQHKLYKLSGSPGDYGMPIFFLVDGETIIGRSFDGYIQGPDDGCIELDYRWVEMNDPLHMPGAYWCSERNGRTMQLSNKLEYLLCSGRDLEESLKRRL